MKSNYKPIGDYIQVVDERNKGLKITTLLGLSISKQFIKSVANVIGTDMENYKIIRKNQFACSTMQVRRDKKMPIALYTEDEPAIISQAYPIFEIKDTTELLPEYLMMWFTRSEFDRQACFHAVGGVRGSLEWEDFCDMQLPIPSIEQQHKIVQEYQTVQNRIALNNQLIAKLEETAQTIYKQWFVDFDFPSPLTPKGGTGGYKSNGGKMVWCEELEKEIPEGWEVGKLSDIAKIVMGQSPNGESYNDIGEGIALINGPVEFGDYFTIKTKWTIDPKKYCKKNDLILCVRGSTVGKYVIADESYAIGRGVCSINSKYHFFISLLIKDNLQLILKDVTGSTFPNLDRKTIEEFKIIMAEKKHLEIFEKRLEPLDITLKSKKEEIQKLESLNELLLARMTKVESEVEILEN
jgi:type I restriction enzyme S subunit